MLYRARYLLPMDASPIMNGALRVEGGRITAMGPSASLPALPGEDIWEGGEHFLLPGLINAHAHLEWHALRGRLNPGLGFAEWVSALRRESSSWSEADFTQGCRLGALESLRHGVTTVVDIGNSGATCAAVADLPLRVFFCLEVLGLDPTLAGNRLDQALHVLRTTPGGPLLRKGLTPHAAYSVSTALFRALSQHGQAEAKATDLAPPFTLHAGESREEEALFSEASGALQTFCQGVFPAAPRHWGKTALGYLRENQLLPEGTLVVHANGRSGEEAAYLASLKATVAHCPQSHAFFGHPAFPADTYRQAGIPLALGTDSLASGHSLSLWDAMRDFSRAHPFWTPEAVLAMATWNPGKALVPGGQLGRLAVGAFADLVAVRIPSPNPHHLLRDLLQEAQDLALVVVAGQPVLV